MRYVKDFYLKKILLRINHNFLAVFYFADKFSSMFSNNLINLTKENIK